jgi:O-methyltransferase involved in polyketide biosynthesis
VICEAVLPYLAPNCVGAVLRAASTFSGSPVPLAADLPVRPTTLRGHAALNLLRVATTVAGETIRTMFSIDDVESLVAGAGWAVNVVRASRELDHSVGCVERGIRHGNRGLAPCRWTISGLGNLRGVFA